MKEMVIQGLEGLDVLAHTVFKEISIPKDTATVLALHGELGSGKTSFTQALARALGIGESLTSPTFVIMRRYPIMKNELFQTLVHIDAYRIDSLEEMRVIGIEQYMQDAQNIMCIEWAEKIKELIPHDSYHITFTEEGIDQRHVTFGFKETQI